MSASLHYAKEFPLDEDQARQDSSTSSPSRLPIEDVNLEPGQRRLSITDERTGRSYEIAISKDSTIEATAFSKLSLTPNYLAGDEGVEGSVLVYDPAFQNTAVIKSSICMVDGEEGKLWYRGIPIEVLVEKSTFVETAHLLIYGYLPNADQLVDWESQIMTHTALHINLGKLMKSFNYDAHPMGMFISTFAAMSTFHPESNPSLQGTGIFNDPMLVNKQIKRIIGKAATVAANAYRHRIGRDFNTPRNQLSYSENFLYMLDAMGEADYRPHPVLVECLDQLFIIHAEHEMNCSTAAMLQIASSGVDPYSSVAGAAAALFGPLHGGANEVNPWRMYYFRECYKCWKR